MGLEKKRLILIFILLCLAGFSFGHLLTHQIKKEKPSQQIEAKYSDSLSPKTLEKVNSHISPQKTQPRKKVIVNSNAKTGARINSDTKKILNTELSLQTDQLKHKQNHLAAQQQEDMDREKSMQTPSKHNLKKRLEVFENNPTKTYLSLGLNGVVDSMHSNKSNGAVFASKLQLQYSLKLAQVWDDNWSNTLEYTRTEKNYHELIEIDKTTVNKKFKKQELVFGTKYSFGKSTQLGALFGIIEPTFYRQIAEDIYHLKSDQSLIVKLQATHPFFRRKYFKLSALGSYEILSAGKVGFKGGSNFGIGIKVNQNIDPISPLGIMLFYKQGNYKSQWANYEMRWLGIGIEYFRLLEGL